MSGAASGTGLSTVKLMLPYILRLKEEIHEKEKNLRA